MAIAAEAVAAPEEAAAFRAISAASAHVPRAAAGTASAARGAYSRVSTPSRTAQTITKLVWAVAIGLIVLEIAAQATGQQWSFSLPGQGKKPTKQPYVPLYTPGQVAASMPGVLPPYSQPSAPGAVPGVAGQNPSAGFVVGPTP